MTTSRPSTISAISAAVPRTTIVQSSTCPSNILYPFPTAIWYDDATLSACFLHHKGAMSLRHSGPSRMGGMR